jgi:hypothetical protein
MADYSPTEPANGLSGKERFKWWIEFIGFWYILFIN